MSLKKSFSLLAILLTFLAVSSFAYAETGYLWDFATSGNAEGWEVGQDLAPLTVVDGVLKTSSSGRSPYIVYPYFLNANSSHYNTLIVRMKTSVSGRGHIFWNTKYDSRFTQNKKIAFPLGKKGRFNNYYLNIKSQNPLWQGTINNILINPQQGKGNIEIDHIKLTKGNLFTNIFSGWQEFWGPRGRVIIGSTINTIQSPNIFGKSMFIYIYWAIGLIILGFILREIRNWFYQKKKPPFKDLFHETGKAIFIATIFFWVLLEINMLCNNWQELHKDFKFTGKSQDEKRTIANPGDFYPFILFCKEHLPQDALFDFRMSPVYSDIKVKYYLYPMKHEKDADFLIIYDMKPEPKLLEKYSLWKKFRQGAYILKKR